MSEQSIPGYETTFTKTPDGGVLHLHPVKQHDGKLDARAWGDGSHAECRIAAHGMVLEVEDIVGETMLHGYLEAEQALSLLTWLQQERAMLEQLDRKDKGQ